MGIALTRAVVGGFITAGMYNQLVDAIMSPPLCRLQKSTPQSTSGTAGTNTAIAFNQETYDPFGMHDPATNSSRITIPQGWGGYYDVLGGARIQFAATSSLLLQFAVNGNIITNSAMRTYGTASQGAICRTTDQLQLNDGDYVELFVQSDTASQALNPGNCVFAVSFIHP